MAERPVLTGVFDSRLESYRDYLTTESAKNLADSVGRDSVLGDKLIHLIGEWRSATYVAAFPAHSARMVESALIAFASSGSEDDSVLGFGEAAITKLSQRVPDLVSEPSLRRQLLRELVNTAKDFLEAKSRVSPERYIGSMWNELQKHHVLQMAICAAQRFAYISCYNAYEAFVVDCVATASGISSIRSSTDEFKGLLKSTFSRDIQQPCWTNSKITACREIRNSLVHKGGKPTNKLLRMKHEVLVHEGRLQVWPHDVKHLLRVLTDGGKHFVDATRDHPCLLANHQPSNC